MFILIDQSHMLFSRPFCKWRFILLLLSSFPTLIIPWVYDSLLWLPRQISSSSITSRPCRHTTPLTELLYKYEALLYCSLWYTEVLRGLRGWNFFLFWSYDAFTSTTTKLAFHVHLLCSVPYLWAQLRGNFSGSNKFHHTWQGIFRKRHCSPAAKDGLPSRRLFSLLQPEFIFSFFLLAYWRKSSLIKCKHI